MYVKAAKYQTDGYYTFSSKVYPRCMACHPRCGTSSASKDGSVFGLTRFVGPWDLLTLHSITESPVRGGYHYTKSSK